jgi:hypothetical protein
LRVSAVRSYLYTAKFRYTQSVLDGTDPGID